MCIYFLYLYVNLYRSAFWAATPKGTKSCRTQGDFSSSVRLLLCSSVHSSPHQACQASHPASQASNLVSQASNLASQFSNPTSWPKSGLSGLKSANQASNQRSQSSNQLSMVFKALLQLSQAFNQPSKPPIAFLRLYISPLRHLFCPFRPQVNADRPSYLSLALN